MRIRTLASLLATGAVLAAPAAAFAQSAGDNQYSDPFSSGGSSSSGGGSSGGSSSSSQQQQQVASAEPVAKPAPKKDGIKAKVSRMIGLRGSEEKPQTADAQAAPSRSPAPKVKTAAASGDAQPAAPAAPAQAPAANGNAMNGSAPIPSSSNFDSRWSAFR